jgi:hypothetical protein
VRNPSGAFLRFGERLALAGEGTVRPAFLAEELGVPTSTLQLWLRQLRFQRVLTPQGREDTVDQARLLQFFGAIRMARLNPSRTFATDDDAAAVSRRLRSAGIPHALGMLSAANEWAFFEPRRRIELYAPRSHLAALHRELAEGRTPVDVFEENMGELPTQERNRAQVTTAFVTVVDCRAHPEGGAHAHFLERNVLRRGGP